MRYLPLLALLAACSPPPFNYAQICTTRGVSIYLERADACAYYEALTDAAIDTASRFGEVHPEGLEVWVWRAPWLIHCPDGAAALGCYVRGHKAVHLNRGGASLAHELLHHLEWLQGVPGEAAMAHAGWGARGATAQSPAQIAHEQRVLPGSWYAVTDAFRDEWDARAEHEL